MNFRDKIDNLCVKLFGAKIKKDKVQTAAPVNLNPAMAGQGKHFHGHNVKKAKRHNLWGWFGDLPVYSCHTARVLPGRHRVHSDFGRKLADAVKG